MRKSLVSICLVPLAIAATANLASAVTIIDPTNSYLVGIGPDGELYNGGSGSSGPPSVTAPVGFQRLSDGFDPILPGTPRDSWGVSVAGIGSAFADYQDFGTSGIVSSTVTSTANTATINTITTLGLNVSQSYSFLAPNILGIFITLTNTSDSAMSDILFQRDVDWDISPTAENEIINIPGLNSPAVDNTTWGFENPDPAHPYVGSCPTGCTTSPGDNGAGIKIDLGGLGSGKSTSFEYLYGLNSPGQTPDQLNAQILALGGTDAIIAESSDGGANSCGDCLRESVGDNLVAATNSAALAVEIPVSTPEPGTWFTMLTGLGAAAGFVMKRRKA